MWSPVIRLRVTRKGQLFIGRRFKIKLPLLFNSASRSRESCEFVCAYPKQMKMKLLRQMPLVVGWSSLQYGMEWNVLAPFSLTHLYQLHYYFFFFMLMVVFDNNARILCLFIHFFYCDQ